MDFALNPDLVDRILDIPYPLPPDGRQDAGRAGRGHDLDSATTSARSTTCSSRPPRGGASSSRAWPTFIAELKAHQPGGQGRLPLGRQHLADHPRPDRDRPGRAQPDPAAVAWTRPSSSAVVRRPAVLLGLDRRAAHPALRHAGRGRGEVRLRLQTLGKNGGLILGPTHHVQLDTPWRTSGRWCSP